MILAKAEDYLTRCEIGLESHSSSEVVTALSIAAWHINLEAIWQENGGIMLILEYDLQFGAILAQLG